MLERQTKTARVMVSDNGLITGWPIKALQVVTTKYEDGEETVSSRPADEVIPGLSSMPELAMRAIGCSR